MNDEIIIPDFQVGCVSTRAYSYTKREATQRLPAIKGRPRYRRKDAHASYLVSLLFEFTEEQWEEFQDFWYDDLESGLKWFTIPLMLDDPEFYQGGSERYLVHATEGFQVAYGNDYLYTVSLRVEVSGGFRTNQADCPIIYGGPIDSLAPDSIYGGPIDALAEDIIIPCPGVDPNG